MTHTVTPTDPDTLTMAQLVEVHNLMADRQISKFRNKETAISRVNSLLAEQGMEIVFFDQELDVRVADSEVVNTDTLDDHSDPVAETVKSGRGRKPQIPDTAAIRLVVTENPKRKGTSSHERYELYRKATTVGDFISAGGRRADIIWDIAHKFIEVEA